MTARRFGGAHSPGGGRAEAPAPGPRLTPAASEPPARVGFWARAMWWAPAPLVFAVIGDILRGAAAELAVELTALVVLMTAAWLLHEGVRAEAAYAARATARRPAVPRKILASVLTGAGVALLSATSWGAGLAPGLLYGAIAGAAHAFAFGPDPLRDKGLEGFDPAETRRVSEALEKAERIVEQTQAAARGLGDRTLEARVEALCAQARAVFRQIEEDPRDLRRARRFLSVYLTGARDATVKYARLGVRDPAMRDAFETLLGDLEKSFIAHRDRLAENDRVDLEVEIEVLQDRLKQEGLG